MIRRALGHLLSCKDVSRLASRAEDSPLTWWQRWLMRMHLAVCEGCSRFDAQLRFLRRAMRRQREGD